MFAHVFTGTCAFNTVPGTGGSAQNGKTNLYYLRKGLTFSGIFLRPSWSVGAYFRG